MFCAISGEAAQNPVVNKKTGAVYEKNLIHKYLADNGNKDPVTSEELTLDDLIEVKTSPSFTPARPPSHSSLPSLLSTLQSEYDSLILETYALKRNYDSVRQELAHALYANDAANRVVARLIGERDGAREALAQIQNTLGVSGGNSVGAEDSEMTDGNAVGGQGSLDSETRETIQASVTKLSGARKGRSKRKAPASYASANDVKSFDQVSTLPSLHSTKPPGVTCMDLSSNGQFLVTGGNDSQINVYDLSTSKLVSNLKGHGKKISKVFFSKTDDPLEVGPNAGNEGKPEFIVSSSELDKSVKIWKLNGNGNEEDSGYEVKDTIKLDSEISGLALHPCGKFFGLTTRNGNFSLYSLESSKLLLSLDAPNAYSVSSEESLGGYKYSSLAFHPDGQLFSIGTSEGIIRIFDLFSSSNVSNFRSQDYETLGEIQSMNFSENGYFFVVSSKNSKDVKVWDLRKQEVVGVLESENGGINEVIFDPSANFVAVLGNDVRVFNNKSWNLLKVYDGNTNSLSSGRWNPKDGSLLVTGIDRTLRVLGKAKEE